MLYSLSALNTHILLIRRESVVDSRGHDHQIMLLQLDPHPVIILASDVKISAAINNISDLFVLVQVLVEKVLDLLLVYIAHCSGRDGDFVTVLVPALGGDRVHIVDVGVVEVEDAEFGEVFWVDGLAAIVWFALVALECIRWESWDVAMVRRDLQVRYRTSMPSWCMWGYLFRSDF